MDLIAQVRRQIEIYGPIAPGTAVWVGVSGGVDSMVLLHVLMELDHPCHVAHVDHGLRGAESDNDLEFVRDQCASLGVPFRAHRCDVAAEAVSTGTSVQMAARKLRYAWFRQLLEGHPTCMALAHHADDAIETLFIGLLQGMGIGGWSVIPDVTRPGTVDLHDDMVDPASGEPGRFIRPLLGSMRSEIEAYARKHAIPFREDSSNQDTTYLRNRIRHHLLPMLEEWRPGSHRVLKRNVRLLRDMAMLSRAQLIVDRTGGVTEVRPGVFRIPFRKILDHASPMLFLQEVLRDAPFHPERLEEIMLAIKQGRSGRRFPSLHGEVQVDRQDLVIVYDGAPAPTWTIPAWDEVPDGAPLTITLENPGSIDTEFVPSVAWFDADRLRYPLELRPWRAGDRMRPIGLDGSKLVSDLLIDAKIPLERKASTYVLVSDERIIWLCGSRIAEGVQAQAGSRVLARMAWPITT